VVTQVREGGFGETRGGDARDGLHGADGHDAADGAGNGHGLALDACRDETVW
jgi:hypothetical protein